MFHLRVQFSDVKPVVGGATMAARRVQHWMRSNSVPDVPTYSHM